LGYKENYETENFFKHPLIIIIFDYLLEPCIEVSVDFSFKISNSGNWKCQKLPHF
jgi:hypothetical protein